MTSVAQAPRVPPPPPQAHPSPSQTPSASSRPSAPTSVPPRSSAGIELELFTAIGEGATTAEALAKRTGAAERGVRILADYLVVDGLSPSATGSYGLSPDAAAFLDRRSPMYLGSMSRFLGNPDFVRRFGRLADAVRRGGSVDENHMVVPEQPLWVEFARSMAPMMAPMAGLVAEAVGRAERVLDIAAGHGLFGIAVGRANPRPRSSRRTGSRCSPSRARMPNGPAWPTGSELLPGERVRGGLRRRASTWCWCPTSCTTSTRPPASPCCARSTTR